MLRIQEKPGFLALLSTDSLQILKGSTTGRLQGSFSVGNDMKYIFSALLLVEQEK